ncbi:hypothetical protein I2I05_18975 [Hymenobacter sp. BT683]|uniref:Uncharacterized protein n=1 Tax=Hymenobacter jeongseonensis TaxID=2791027 RepID=A0ABS0IM91_9BACT|nr:hypothetical protein [Hymenobacter jeongseonensis]MBF9239484.1 hypothetical protein [Hymenobacter jeongseonensis]
MSFPHLDQVIELNRGEAGQLWWAVADCGRRNAIRLHQNQGLRVESAGVVVALPALLRVAKRLKRLDDRELRRVGVPKNKPVQFRLRCDELVALMLYVWPHSYSGHVVLGKVQQVSLNLEHLIKFT